MIDQAIAINPRHATAYSNRGTALQALASSPPTIHRILMMMPHPERSLRYAQLSWQANASPLDQATPWQHLFHNALRYFK